MSDAIVKVRCVACGDTRDITAGEIAPGEVPMCRRCFSPMVAVEARTERSPDNAP